MIDQGVLEMVKLAAASMTPDERWEYLDRLVTTAEEIKQTIPGHSTGEPPLPGRHTLQLLHDRMTAVILGETEIRPSDKGKQLLSLQCGVLCWMLGHEHNVAFPLNMNRLSRDLHSHGMALVLPEPLPALVQGPAGELRRAGERFVLIRPEGEEKAIAIQCLTCFQTSHNPGDVQNLYCGNCKSFHMDALDAEIAELERLAEGNLIPLAGEES